MIDYGVVHPLVHLIEPHHTNVFWDRVGSLFPSA
ncbi:MAG TPA: hypothetical protein DCY91_27765 [Cyanobacteria bacterium UBA11370]|nr:hypothetical protein [Cyanobacteria bacterium UBA11370]HBY80106.1 hypothetical protein [Cyanobacteria bacterium UBA11148]